MNEILIAVIGALAGLSASIVSLATFLVARADKKGKKRTAESNMLMGLGHDRIVFLGQQYIKRGYITKDEYENLHDYLYKPYSELGGNGTAAKVMKEVEGLALREKEE